MRVAIVITASVVVRSTSSADSATVISLWLWKYQ